MQPIVRQIHKLLLKKHLSVALAESCTGGLVSKLLTDLSHSSRYFITGLVVYSNKSKAKLLKIPPGLIARHGAVSEKIAVLMAQNVRKAAKSDFGIGLTGIAGPSGGTTLKPVGTVYIAVSGRRNTSCSLFHFQGSRDNIRRKSALKSLELLKQKIIA